MKLDELFGNDVKTILKPTMVSEESMVASTENYIIDRITQMQASNMDKVYLKPLEDELASAAKSTTSNVMAIDREFLLDFLNTLDSIDSIDPVQDTPEGDTNFVINFKMPSRAGHKGEDQEKQDKDKISKDAMKAIGKKGGDEKSKAKTKGASELDL